MKCGAWGVLVSIFLAFVCVFSFNTSIFDNAFAQENKNFASGWVVLETKSKRVLDAGNENVKLPMASTTKIITCILTILNHKDLNKIIAIPKEACGIEGSTIYLKPNEHLTVLELLYGLMLSSGNDAAVALALETFGSIENFQNEANEFCRNLGAVNTNIVTPNGLHDPNHYTTAYDLALITAYALQNQTFREIVSTKRKTISNEFKKTPRTLINKNKMLQQYPNATGVKIGYTKAAGRCLVSSAEKNNMELVCVVLNCNDWFNKSTELLNKAFNNYKLECLLPEHYHFGKFACQYGDNKEINLYSEKEFCFPITNEEKKLIRKQVELPNLIKAPVKKGECVGKVSFYLENKLLFSENIYSMEESKSIRIKDIFTRLWSDLLF